MLQPRRTSRTFRGLGNGCRRSNRIGMSPLRTGVTDGKRPFSLSRMTDATANFDHGTRIPSLIKNSRINSRRHPTTKGKRLSTTASDAAGEGAAAAEPTSEETAQQLSQLLEQPLALESFITKELTPNQRQAIQRLVRSSDVDVDVPEPSYHSLRLVAMNTAIPFVGFGIMDNMM